MIQCPSSVLINGRRVRCAFSEGHAADGRTLFAFHTGAPSKSLKPGAHAPGKATAGKSYSWTDAEDGKEIGEALGRNRGAPGVGQASLFGGDE